MSSIQLGAAQDRSYGFVRLYALAGGPFRASRFTVWAGQTTQMDRHTVRELWLVLEGTGALVREEVEYAIVQPGDAVQFDSNEPHQVKNTGTGDLVILSIWWQP